MVERYCIKETFCRWFCPSGIIEKVWTFEYSDGTFEQLRMRGK